MYHKAEKTYIENKNFEGINFNTTVLINAEYENCVFTNCIFSNLDLSKFSFSACEFRGCNLSLATLTGTGFQDIIFKDCKLLGLHFDHCSEFRFNVEFDHCILNMSSFYKRKLKKQRFKDSSLQDVDFTEADLTSAVFDHCDLAKASFDNTILEKADFRTAFNYSIIPGRNKLKKAKFSLPAVIGLLDNYDIVIEP
jgi:uncharacterized protein YjbI with pentapeptide repeats